MAGHLGVRALGMGHTGRNGGVELQLAVHVQVGGQSLQLVAGVAHFVHVLALAGTQGRIAEVSNLGIDAEDLGGLGSLQTNLHQLVLGGLDVDGAVPHSQDLVLADAIGADQNEAGGHDLVAGLGLDDLQGGTDRVGGGIGGAAQQSVGIAHLHQHGAEVVGLLEELAALLLTHLALAQLHQGGDHLLHVGEGLGINDLSAPDVEAGFLGSSLDLIEIAHQHRGQEGTGQQAGGRLQNAGIRALSEDNLPGMGLQLFDQKFKHL